MGDEGACHDRSLRGAVAAGRAPPAASLAGNTKTPSPGRNAGKDEVSAQPRTASETACQVPGREPCHPEKGGLWRRRLNPDGIMRTHPK